MTVELDPDHLRQFCEGLARGTTVRISKSEIWDRFVEAFPGRPRGRRERAWLCEALQQARDRGVIAFPSRSGNSWDRSRSPALPTFVRRERTSDENDGPPAWKADPWHPKLSWVPDLPYLTDRQETLLRAVHDRLATGGFQSEVPMAVRSLKLVGEEKMLRDLVDTQLFEEGRLSLDLLACRRSPLPLPWERVGPGGDWIVFENSAPFSWTRRVLTELEAPPYGVIAYGKGQNFPRTLRYLLTVEAEVESLTYVGDLDVPGLQIADIAAQRLADVPGLPPLQRATDLYEQMLDAAADLGFEDGFPHEVDPPTPSAVREATSELPARLRAQVADVLEAGRRLPEEVLAPGRLQRYWQEAG